MSLTVARSIAYTALAASQTRIAASAANIANADTDGYTRKTAVTAAVVQGTAGAGVTVTAITAAADRLLQKSIVAATSRSAAAETASAFAERIAALAGTIDSSGEGAGTSIADAVTAFETALAALAATPESATLKSAVVTALDDLAGQLRETSSALQDLRADADRSIADEVTAANAALARIDALNDAIVAAEALGQPTGDLEDQRASALTELAGHLDVGYGVGTDGRMRVYTSAGKILVGDSVHELSFTAAAAVSATTGTLCGITVDGDDITASIGSGGIAAALTVRDETIPAVQAELDALAAGLAGTLNAIHNSGSADPAPSSLTGIVTVAAGDAFTATGSLRVAILDDDGTVVSTAVLDLSACATAADLIAALDAVDGLAASIDADGHLVLAADDPALGVALADIDAAVGAEGTGFSAAFGLDDLVTGSGAADIAVRADILADPARLAAALLSTETGLAAGDSGLAGGSGEIAAALQTALTEARDFPAAGGLGARSRSLSGYATDIVAGLASDAETAAARATARQTALAALTDRFASETGVNLDEETAALSDLQQSYQAAAQLIAILNDLFDVLMETVR